MNQARTGVPRPPPRHPRQGPRPLALHLSTATLTWLSSAAALPFLSGDLRGSKATGAAKAGNEPAAPWPATMGWAPELKDRAAALLRELAAADPEALRIAVGREVRRRLDELETGIRRYRAHPYRRAFDPPPPVWREGTTRLLDYGVVCPQAARGRPLLVVPSLINRAYILDLTPARSLLRHRAEAGFRPFLVDWDRPGPTERSFGFDDYILGRLGRALDRVRVLAGGRPAVVGYCMGGLLALALAAARTAEVSGLALLATPWDFHADRPGVARAMGYAVAPWLPLVEMLGEMPLDLLQSLFFGLDPFLGARKFRAFAALDPASPRAEEFVALEDWLNDGVPLAAAVARESIFGWYGENTPGRGEWRVGGRAVRPEMLAMPSLVVVPEQDRIVPPASAAALARAIPGAETLAPPLGHIGMMVGGRATETLWRPLAAWLARLQPEGVP